MGGKSILDNYEVGYGKPPRDHQFRPGQSGNPKGRAQGTKNLKTDLAEELQERILVREGERPLEISKQRAIVKTLVTKTLRGDARITSNLLNLMIRVLDLEGAAADAEQPLSFDESEVLAAFEERLSRRANRSSTGDDPGREGGSHE